MRTGGPGFIVWVLLLVIPSTVAFAQSLNHQRVDTYHDYSGREQPVKTQEDWQLRRKEILAGMQQAMGDLPTRENLPDLKVEVLEEFEGDGFVRRTIRMVAEPGDKLTADLYLPVRKEVPESTAAKLPAMLTLHSTGPLGKRIVAGEGPRLNRAYGIELAQRGYVVLAPDYPSFGDLQDYDFAADRYSSGTMKGIWNHLRCVDLLESMPEVDANRIGVIGHSLGGHNAIFAAVFDERLKVIVSSCGWTPFHNYYNGKLAGWASDRYMPSLREKYGLDPDKVPFDFYELIAALAPRPFFTNSPLSDDNFAIAGVKKAIPEAAKIYELYAAKENLQARYPPCGHDFPTEIREEAYRFIDRAFAHKPWVTLDFSSELPRLAPRDPQAALKSLVTRPGYQVELVAAEPLVTDPVAMCFDPNTNLYVVEMRDYSEQDQEQLGRVRFLEDTDGDGTYDKATIFADKLSWPTAIIGFEGGVFVGAPPNIYYLKDTDGDHRADIQRTVFTGFGRTNVQGLLNSFRWGLDNRIHGATSSSGGLIVRPEVKMQPVDLRGRDFSFDPRLLDIRPEAGGAQHGMCFDDWGRKYCCSNSDHLQVVMYDDRYAARNPFFKAPSPRLSIAADGGQAPVFRRSPIEPWRIVRTRLRVAGVVAGPVEGGGKPAGYFTGATGVTIYRGDAMPTDRGRAFIGDVGSNLVHRKQIVEDELVPRGERIDDKCEFLSADDVWFRPVQFANAPDGTLHVLDMSREVIEHPASLPPEIKQHLDLTSGREQGRLYRMVPEGFRPRAIIRPGSLPSAELVPLLAHANAWHRESAAQLLFERQDPSVVAALEQMVLKGAQPLGTMQALYVLRGLQALRAEVVTAALKNADPHVREHAVRLAEAFPENANVRAQLSELVEDDDLHVRFQLAFSLGEFPTSFRVPLAAKLLAQDGTNDWLRSAVFTSLATGAGEVFALLASDAEFMKQDHSVIVLDSLAEMIGRLAQEDQVAHLLQAVTKEYIRAEDRSRLMQRLVLELAASKSPVAKRLTSSDAIGGILQEILLATEKTVADKSAPEATRIAAVHTLALDASVENVERLIQLLDGRQPIALQFATLQTLASMNQGAIADELIAHWPMLTPELRKEAVEVLLSREPWTISFLTALEEQKIPRAEWNPARLTLLKATAAPAMRERLEKLLAADPAGPRGEVVERYSAALSIKGDIGRGRELFVRHCAACHQLEGRGQPIGPNLAAIRNRGSEAIVLNVFDPNREVNPDFLTYTILTTDGRSTTGIIAEQSANGITLKRADVREETILRQDIQALKSTGLSLMPEGFEKLITVEQMADLLTYLLQH